MTREGNILDFQGNKIAPNTGTPQVTDVAKQQGLSQTLLNTPDKDALGYEAFSTVIAYSAGDIVYYENKLWKCKAGGHAAGAWNANDFDAWSIGQEVGVIKTDISGKADKVASATDNHLAALDASGNLKDSGSGIDNAPTEDSDNVPKSGGVFAAIATAFSNVKQWASDLFAQKDGSYEELNAGSADTINGNSPVTLTRVFGETGGEGTEPGSGIAPISKIAGNVFVYNQLYPSPYDGTVQQPSVPAIYADASHTTPLGYLYLQEKLTSHTFAEGEVPVGSSWYDADGFSTNAPTAGVAFTGWRRETRVTHTAYNTWFTLNSTQRNVINMALCFGIKGTSQTAYSLEPTAATYMPDDMLKLFGQQVGVRNCWPYSSGKLLPAVVVGFESSAANLLDATTGKARLFEYSYEGHNNIYHLSVGSGTTIQSISFIPDITGEPVEITPDSSGNFEIVGQGVLTVAVSAGSLANVCVRAQWGDDDNEITEAKINRVVFDVRKIVAPGQGDGGSDVVVFPDGLRGVSRGASSILDIIDLENAECDVNIGSKDLGDLSWTKGTSVNPNNNLHAFYATINGRAKINVSEYPIDKLSSYHFVNNTSRGYFSYAAFYSATDIPSIYIFDAGKDSLNAEQFASAVGGVKLFFPLSTPVHYTDLVYRDNGVDTPLSVINQLVSNEGWQLVLLADDDAQTGIPTSSSPSVTQSFSIDVAEWYDSAQHGNLLTPADADNFGTAIAAVISSATGMTVTYDGDAKTFDENNGWQYTNCFSVSS